MVESWIRCGCLKNWKTLGTPKEIAELKEDHSENKKFTAPGKVVGTPWNDLWSKIKNFFAERFEI